MDIKYLKQSHADRRRQYELFMHPYSKNFDVIIKSAEDGVEIFNKNVSRYDV